jgi:SAM-dependent methyltransferase
MSKKIWRYTASLYPILRMNPISSGILRKEIMAVNSLLTEIPDNSFEIVGDIGTGRGHSLELIPDQARLKFALDNCMEMIIHTRVRFPGIYFSRAEALHLPIKNAIFDLILCIGLLEYVYDMERLLNQINAALKAEKYLLITQSPRHILNYLRYLTGHKLYTRNTVFVEKCFNLSGFKIIGRKTTLIQQQYLLQKKSSL